MLKYISLFIVLATFLSSCSKTDNPVTPGSSSFVQPKAGSSFTYDEYATDTTTAQPVPGSRDTSVQTIVQTGMTYNGKTNVTKIISVTSGNNDTSYINFESNGDLSVYINGLSIPQKWFTFPTGSKSTNSVTLSDTTQDVFGVSIETKVVLTASFVDNETMTVKGQFLSVTKIKQAFTITITTAGVPNIQSQNSFLYFAPSIGYVTKSETPVSTDLSGAKAQGHLSILFDYTLK